jgi:hypothetical protein
MTSQQKDLNDLRGKMAQETSPKEKFKLAALARKERIGREQIVQGSVKFSGFGLSDLKIVGVH